MATLNDQLLALLARTPISARRVRYLGVDADAFEAALKARNPAAELVGQAADAMVVTDITALVRDPAPLASLAPGGMVAGLSPPGCPTGRHEVLAGLSAGGVGDLRLLSADPGQDAFDDRDHGGADHDARAETTDAGFAVVGRRGLPQEPLHLHKVAFAPQLMDIRTRLPAHALRTEPSLVVSYRRAPFRSLPELAPGTPKVLVLQRPAERRPEVWLRSMAECIRQGWLVVIEQDDHPDLIAESLGVSLSDFEWGRLSLVHAVQTSTPQLAAAFAQANPEVTVFENAVFELGPPPGPRPRRVFYGAINRGPLAAEIARAMAPVVARFPDLEFVVVRDRAVFEALPTERKVFHEPMPYEAYLELMAGCAVSLSPIAPTPHSDTKSDAKFLDAAARGTVTVASPSVYAATIRHRETGLIAERPEEWAGGLSEILADEPFRRRLADGAYAYVRDHRMFADQAQARIAWYRSLWDRREALNAALARRMADVTQAGSGGAP